MSKHSKQQSGQCLWQDLGREGDGDRVCETLISHCSGADLPHGANYSEVRQSTIILEGKCHTISLTGCCCYQVSTSVDSERLFSAVSNITDKRNRLSANRVEMLVFLNKNLMANGGKFICLANNPWCDFLLCIWHASHPVRTWAGYESLIEIMSPGLVNLPKFLVAHLTCSAPSGCDRRKDIQEKNVVSILCFKV